MESKDNKKSTQATPKKLHFPHTFIILIILIFIASALTYLIPAGEFERVFDENSKQTLVIAGSYQEIENSPIAPYFIFHKFFEAICQPKNATLMFFIMFIGGAFEIIMQSGCMTALCENVLLRMKGRELWIIPIFVCLFSIFGFTMGLTTASVVFVPIGIAAASALGIPKMCGMAMIALGTNAGFTAGIFNPFSVGIAQTIAEIPIYSGAGLRWIVLIVLNVVTSLYLMWYARKYRSEVVVDIEHKHTLSIREKVVLAQFVVTFLILTVGIARYEWGTTDIVVVFLFSGIIMGLSSGFDSNKICVVFIEGCRKMIKGVLIIGMAATIRLILEEGNILDTIVYKLTELVYFLPGTMQLLGIFFFNAIINFLITSGSTKAALVMPILTPMADFFGLSRQSMVFAFQLGDGLTNLASPVSTTLNGVLAMSEETYDKWIKFYIPLVGIYVILGSVFVLVARTIGY